MGGGLPSINGYYSACIAEVRNNLNLLYVFCFSFHCVFRSELKKCVSKKKCVSNLFFYTAHLVFYYMSIPYFIYPFSFDVYYMHLFF